jgi:hypothetical protein
METRLLVDIAPMRDSRNSDMFCYVINVVDHAPVAESYAPLMFVAFEFSASRRTGVLSESQNFPVDSIKEVVIQRV